MKIIKAGNPGWVPWWVGLHVHCDNCGRIVELEPEDKLNAYLQQATLDNFQFTCEQCGKYLVVKRKDNA